MVLDESVDGEQGVPCLETVEPEGKQAGEINQYLSVASRLHHDANHSKTGFKKMVVCGWCEFCPLLESI